MAQEYDCTVVSPYQMMQLAKLDSQKVFLDAADAAFALESMGTRDNCLTFNCVKMRSASMETFTSTMDWETLEDRARFRTHSRRTEMQLPENDEDIHDL